MEDAALAELLAANGHDTNNMAACSSITELEMFLQAYPKMLALHRFPELRELRLIDQRIARIEGLAGCQRLQCLWLTENRITEVAGLQACTALQELYLTSNRITAVQGLEALTGLKVLWLADNYISSISGLASLSQLQQLHLARNYVADIGASLGSCTALTSLNLAHNHISNLQDATTSLSRLTRLQELCFADPLWGACPVAILCNYQTFVLAALPQLASLDTLLLADETKAAAAATFAKKRLYYSMRTRTLQCAAGNLCRHAAAALQAQVACWDRLYARLAYAAGCIQGQPDSKPSAAAETSSSQRAQDLATLTRLMAAVLEQQGGLRQRFATDCEQSAAGLAEASARLELELGSAGNIWLEHGRPGDSWLQGCLELLSTLMSGGEAGHAAAGGIKVLSAARTHNRHLRTQFAKHTGSTAGGSVVHLCYAEPGPGELMHVAQHGFGSSCSSSSGAAIQLATSINLAVPPPAAQRAPGSAAGSNRAGSGWGRHQVLVCKASLGGVKSAGSHQQQDSAGISPQQFPGVAAVYQAVGSSSCGQVRGTAGKAQQQQQQRLWHVFDATAVLPEFLVTFEYIGSSRSSSSHDSSRAPVVEFDVGAPLPVAPCSAGSLSLCVQPLHAWLDAAAELQQQGATATSSSLGGLGRALGASAQVVQQCEAVLTMLGPLACRKLPALSSTMLQSVTGGQQLAGVTFLSLQDCGLQRFDVLLSHLPRLASLVLSFNRLTSLHGLVPAEALCPLTRLDVSHNLLSSWDRQWLAGCAGSLAVLHASHNLLAQPKDLQHLRHLSRLQELSLASNPVQQHKAYQVALAGLSQLRLLDGLSHACKSPLVTIPDAGLLRDGATLWHSDDAGPVPVLHTLGGSSDWRLLLHSVVLDGRSVAELQGLADAAPNLVSASFQGNLLEDLSGLAGCSLLRCLCLADNLITELAPLLGLMRLQQLDVSHNSVSSLAPLSALGRLTQLDCRDNRVASLTDVTSLTRLVELYAANNTVADIEEAEQLVTLPSLAVLDLSGTPLATTEGYRLLVLFRLPRLKVLDGTPAGAAEVATAHAQHAGRLTLSQLEARCGSGCVLSSLQALDVSAMGLTNLGDAFAASGPLARLTALVLDSNHVRSLAPLAALTRLLTLSLNANLLGAAEPGSISFAGTAAAVAAGGGCRVAAAGLAPPPLLPSLQVLHMAGNDLTALAPLQLGCLPALRSLFVQGNELASLDGLEGLVQLRELVADRNRIRVLEPDSLSSVVWLRELRLEDNRLKGIALPAGFSKCSSIGEALAGCLPSLAALHLGGNRLPDVHDCVEKLCGLPCLTELSLLNNPLARKQVYRTLLISRCSQLQCIDGQVVTQEERERVQAMASLASPRRCSVELLPGCVGDAAAMLLAAAADCTGAAAAAGAGSSAAGPAGGSRAVGSSPKVAAMGHHQGIPPVLNYEALARTMAARHGLFGGGSGSGSVLFPGSSVPSIQSGVLMLTGAASFGLEGTAIGGASAGTGGASTQQQGSRLAKQASIQVGAATSSSRRVTTGSIPPGGAIVSSRAGGFTVRQATFH